MLLHGVAFLSWNQHPEPTGSRRATPLLLFQHSSGHPAWTVLTSRSERLGRLEEGLISTSRIIFLGLCMDTVYQLIVLKAFYPVEAIIVALVLAFLPYLLLRGPVARIARLRKREPASGKLP